MTGTVALESLGSDQTRGRISLRGVAWDSETYPTQIRRLQEETERQLFLRAVRATVPIP